MRVLGRSAVGPEENFFDLGGDSLLAVRLFSEIAQAVGRQIPPVMVYQIPTIAAQGAFLDQPANTVLSPLVLIKRGGQDNIFIVPGLGGGPAGFFPLSKCMRTPHSIFSFQPKGIGGLEEPDARIEDMADFYADAIARLQPQGPYILFGYSLGGLVAVEMARRFSARGEKIALLVMVDSYPDMNYLAPGQRMRVLWQKAKRRMRKFVYPDQTSTLSQGLVSLPEMSTFAPAFAQVRDFAYLALRRYKPVFYPGKVKFIRADQVSEFPADPVRVWSHLVGQLEVETVPGDHLGLLTAHYQDLAAVLDRCLGNL